MIADIILALSAVLNASLVYLVYSKFRNNQKVNLASFQLQSKEVVKDFQILLVITVIFGIATLSVFYGSYSSNNTLYSIGEGLSAFSSFLPLIVFYRWWRRFR